MFRVQWLIEILQPYPVLLKNAFTDKLAVDVTIQAFICEGPDSNFCPNTGYLDRFFYSFPESLLINAGILSGLDHTTSQFLTSLSFIGHLTTDTI